MPCSRRARRCRSRSQHWSSCTRIASSRRRSSSVTPSSWLARSYNPCSSSTSCSMLAWICSSAIRSSLAVVAGGHQILELGMLIDYVPHERAQRHDLEPLPARVLENAQHELRPEPSRRASLVDLGVRDDEPSVPPAVRGEPDQPPAEP